MKSFTKQQARSAATAALAAICAFALSACNICGGARSEKVPATNVIAQDGNGQPTVLEKVRL